ncbi:MAG: cytochrome c oxidase assembly factor Coa1 family protein [Candidatus Acidiferrales bacterium]
MNAPPIPAIPGFPAPQRRKSWLNNWKVLVPVLILVIALCFGLFVFAILSFVYSMFRNSYPYKMAIQNANASTEVTAEIGTPVHVGWWTTGNINYNNSDADADFSIPISGARGSGHIIVVGKKRAGRWAFQTFEVDVDGQKTPIQLMNPAVAPALPPATVPASPAQPGSA